MKNLWYYIQKLSKKLGEHEIAAYSAQMAYFFVLSIFPLLIFTFSILSRLNIDFSFAITALQTHLPVEVSEIIVGGIERSITINGNATLSLSGLVMLYSASRGINALKRAIEIAYSCNAKKNFLREKIYAMLYTLSFIALIIASLLIPSLGYKVFHVVNNFFHVPIGVEWFEIFYFVRNLILGLLYVFIFGSIYMYLPTSKKSLKQTYKGSLFAMFGSLIANSIFSSLVSQFTDYSVVYGSLSAVIAFMVWLYVLGTIVIIGAEINAIEIES